MRAMKAQHAALILAFILLFADTTTAVNAAPSRASFCAFWQRVCVRTSPPSSTKICATRQTDCLSSGCYFFNNPRPRCESNEFDLKLMTPEMRGKGCPDCR